MQNGIYRRFAVALILTAVTAFAGCDDSNGMTGGTPGPGGAALVSMASTPSSGDADFSNPTILHETNQGVDMLDVVRLSETVGTIYHEIDVYWVPGTGEIRSVQHGWGDPSGSGASTGCWVGGPPCDPAGVSVDEASQVVTFTDLALPDTSGGASTSTLDGTVLW